MIGTQGIINRLLMEHEDCPIKGGIGKHTQEDIVCIATEEMWKEWKRLMSHSDKPEIYIKKLGKFRIMKGRTISYLNKVLYWLKKVRKEHPEDYKNPEKRAFGINRYWTKKFSSTWKQLDYIKKEFNYKEKIWKEKKIKRYGDKAIL